MSGSNRRRCSPADCHLSMEVAEIPATACQPAEIQLSAAYSPSQKNANLRASRINTADVTLNFLEINGYFDLPIQVFRFTIKLKGKKSNKIKPQAMPQKPGMIVLSCMLRHLKRVRFITLWIVIIRWHHASFGPYAMSVSCDQQIETHEQPTISVHSYKGSNHS